MSIAGRRSKLLVKEAPMTKQSNKQNRTKLVSMLFLIKPVVGWLSGMKSFEQATLELRSCRRNFSCRGWC